MKVYQQPLELKARFTKQVNEKVSTNRQAVHKAFGGGSLGKFGLMMYDIKQAENKFQGWMGEGFVSLLLRAFENLQKTQKRADKNLWITAILTLFIPFGGYIYTLRYTAAVIAFFAMMFLISAEDVMDEDSADTLYGLFMVGTAVENSLSVRKARELAKKQGLTPGASPATALPNPQVQILKIGKRQEEMTLSDLVIATELPPEQLQQTLMELERSDLVRCYNRESDGAVVYKVV